MKIWDSVPGQGILKRRLYDMVRGGQISHAFILEGNDRAERMTLARGFAQTLLCESGKGCGECRSCRLVEMGSHLDVISVFPEKGEWLTVDEIRRKLVDDMEIRPYRDAYKIYLVDPADKMTVEAQNALLKTLEEPPSYGIILLLADNSENFLPTILSRSVLLRMQPAEEKEELFSEEERKAVLDVCCRLPAMDSTEISQAVSGWQEVHLASSRIFLLLRFWFRDLLLWKSVENSSRLFFHRERNRIRETAEKYTFSQIQTAFTSIDKAEKQIFLNVNETMVYTNLLMNCRPEEIIRPFTPEEFEEYLIPGEEERQFYGY